MHCTCVFSDRVNSVNN